MVKGQLSMVNCQLSIVNYQLKKNSAYPVDKQGSVFYSLKLIQFSHKKLAVIS